MSFYSRIRSGNIPYDEFLAAAGENIRDNLTVGDLESMFNLDANESNEMQDVINVFGGDPPLLDAAGVRNVLLLAHGNTAGYNSDALMKAKLGIA